MNYEFYRDIHQQEFERGNALSGRASAILAGLTTVAGALAFLAVGFKGAGCFRVMFWMLAVAAGIAVAVSAWFLLASYKTSPLEDLEKPSAWRRYEKELTAEYRSGPGAFASAAEEYEDGLIATYIEATERNIDVNTLRGFRLTRSNVAMLAAFALVLLAGLDYYYEASMQPPTLDLKKVIEMLSMSQPLEATKPGTRPVPNPSPPRSTP
jgi:hypothetical protein